MLVGSAPPAAPRRAAGPVVDPVPCSGCGKLLDPLRAGHVAIFDLRFHYFCSREVCRTAFLGGEIAPRAPASEAPVATPRPPAPLVPPDAAPILPAHPPVGPDEPLPLAPPTRDDRSLVEPIGHTVLSEAATVAVDPGAAARDVGGLLLVIAIIAGALAVALALAGDARLVLWARVVLALVGGGMLLGRALTTPRDVPEPHPAPVLSSALASIAVATWASFGRDRSLGSEAASLAGVIVTAAAVGAWLAESGRRAVAAERGAIADALSSPLHRPSSDKARGDAREEVGELRPGETVVVDAGEIVPVDLVIAGGGGRHGAPTVAPAAPPARGMEPAPVEVEVYPWLGATTRSRRREGEPVVAGAKVARGRLRGTVTWTGSDRAFARVLLDPRRRADAHAPIAISSRSLAERWAVIAAVVGGISAVIAGRSPIESAMVALAVHAALATPVIGTIASVHAARGVLLGLRRGIAYKSSDAWDRAGRVAVAVFCARGTLLLGEPELAEVEAPSGKLSPSDVLALAAGAERAEGHPIATAIVRAARARGLRPDGVRNPNQQPGLGVTAVSSSGEELCVGNRALMLEQRIAIGAAEQRIAELEALGRTVILVALGARLVGLLALQDGIRPGARAAVQHLLDAQIEPVLISGDARETCEAIGRSLDIDHIRPEVLPQDRNDEVRRLIDAGMTVAVLGHAGVDDAALGAADVAVALAAAGSAPGDYAVALAADDVRDAALSLALARRTRVEARAGLALAVVPALVGAVAIAFGILPAAYAPIAALLGAAVAITHARALERVRLGAGDDVAEELDA